MKDLKYVGEAGLVKMFRRRYRTGRNTAEGIGDDAALVKAPASGFLQVLTCDTLAQGVHFPAGKISGCKIGWKALGAALSDIAAVGGIPKTALISLAMPRDIRCSFVNEFIRGIDTLARRFGVDIAGGDTVASKSGIIVTVSVSGIVEKEYAVLRRGARPGDKILVTGKLGGSRLGKQYTFIPRIKEARRLVKDGRITAMIDITDGLAADICRIASASGTGVLIYEEAVPVSYDARRFRAPFERAMYDGEDFELLFTAKDAFSLKKKWGGRRPKLSVIGEITQKKDGFMIKDRRGNIKRFIPKGYDHFKP